MSKVWRYGDHVDTDVIIPARYLNISDFNELAEHAMEDSKENLTVNFAANVKPGDIVVAGKNFGCGSSREHAPMVLKVKGVKCIIADSFARIFYRNAINIGLPILECPEASEGIENGDEVSIDFDSGVITNLSKNQTYQAQAFPEFIKHIISANGLLNSLKEEA